MEKNIITAIKKSSPALLLAGTGLPGKRYWITRNKSFLILVFRSGQEKVLIFLQAKRKDRLKLQAEDSEKNLENSVKIH